MQPSSSQHTKKSTDLKGTRAQLWQLLAPESSFYGVIIVYGVAISLLTLAVPIAVQTLINSIANIVQTVTAQTVTGSAVANGFGDVTGIQNSQLNLVGDGSLQATVSLSSSS